MYKRIPRSIEHVHQKCWDMKQASLSMTHNDVGDGRKEIQTNISHSLTLRILCKIGRVSESGTIHVAI